MSVGLCGSAQAQRCIRSATRTHPISRCPRVGRFVRDDVELVLRGATRVAAFRASATSPGLFPFSNSDTARRRNRERLLRVRKLLFERSGWRCACPPGLNALAAAQCTLTCGS